MSFNHIGYLCGVSAQAILNWVRDFAAEYAEKPQPEGKAVILELDELWHYLQKKKCELWVWTAVDRVSGRLLDWELGDRDAETLERLLNRLKKYNITICYAGSVDSGEEQSLCQNRSRWSMLLWLSLHLIASMKIKTISCH